VLLSPEDPDGFLRALRTSPRWARALARCC